MNSQLRGVVLSCSRALASLSRIFEDQREACQASVEAEEARKIRAREEGHVVETLCIIFPGLDREVIQDINRANERWKSASSGNCGPGALLTSSRVGRAVEFASNPQSFKLFHSLPQRQNHIIIKRFLQPWIRQIRAIA